MLKFTQFCNFKELRKNQPFFEIAAQAFKAGNFLNIFLRFLDFWGSFSDKNFSYKKTPCISSHENKMLQISGEGEE